MQPQNDAYAYIHTLDRMVIVHLLRPPDLYEDGPILSKYTLPAFRGRYFFFFAFETSFRTLFWCLCYGLVFVIVFYKEKKIREINDKFVFFFQKQTKTRESKNRLIIKPYLVTNLQENLILEGKLVILSQRRKRKIKQ